jgi:hypothetical protein
MRARVTFQSSSSPATPGISSTQKLRHFAETDRSRKADSNGAPMPSQDSVTLCLDWPSAHCGEGVPHDPRAHRLTDKRRRRSTESTRSTSRHGLPRRPLVSTVRATLPFPARRLMGARQVDGMGRKWESRFDAMAATPVAWEAVPTIVPVTRQNSASRANGSQLARSGK